MSREPRSTAFTRFDRCTTCSAATPDSSRCWASPGWRRDGDPDIVELIRAVVRNELGTMHVTELGVVGKARPHASAGDKENCACDVMLRDIGLELKGVPVATQRIGHVAIPNVGDLVLIGFVHGDIQNPVIVGRLHNNVDRPPVAKDEEWVYVCPDAKKSGVRRAHFAFRTATRRRSTTTSSCWRWARPS